MLKIVLFSHVLTWFGTIWHHRYGTAALPAPVPRGCAGIAILCKQVPSNNNQLCENWTFYDLGLPVR
jgi:hypothetical protein